MEFPFNTLSVLVEIFCVEFSLGNKKNQSTEYNKSQGWNLQHKEAYAELETSFQAQQTNNDGFIGT